MTTGDSTAAEVTAVVVALQEMKREKAPREDGILVDVLRDARMEVRSRLAHLPSYFTPQERLPE